MVLGMLSEDALRMIANMCTASIASPSPSSVRALCNEELQDALALAMPIATIGRIWLEEARSLLDAIGRERRARLIRTRHKMAWIERCYRFYDCVWQHIQHAAKSFGNGVLSNALVLEIDVASDDVARLVGSCLDGPTMLSAVVESKQVGEKLRDLSLGRVSDRPIWTPMFGLQSISLCQEHAHPLLRPSSILLARYGIACWLDEALVIRRSVRDCILSDLIRKLHIDTCLLCVADGALKLTELAEFLSTCREFTTVHTATTGHEIVSGLNISIRIATPRHIHTITLLPQSPLVPGSTRSMRVETKPQRVLLDSWMLAN